MKRVQTVVQSTDIQKHDAVGQDKGLGIGEVSVEPEAIRNVFAIFYGNLGKQVTLRRSERSAFQREMKGVDTVSQVGDVQQQVAVAKIGVLRIGEVLVEPVVTRIAFNLFRRVGLEEQVAFR